MTRFEPGSFALIRGSYEEVTIIAQHDDTVLVARAGGQWPYRADELEPLEPDVCPID